jgi:hypothetical protein
MLAVEIARNRLRNLVHILLSVSSPVVYPVLPILAVRSLPKVTNRQVLLFRHDSYNHTSYYSVAIIEILAVKLELLI